MSKPWPAATNALASPLFSSLCREAEVRRLGLAARHRDGGRLRAVLLVPRLDGVRPGRQALDRETPEIGDDQDRQVQTVDRPGECRSLGRQPPMHWPLLCLVHFAAKLKSAVLASLPATVTVAVCVPYFSCHASMVYVPGGRPLIVKLPRSVMIRIVRYRPSIGPANVEALAGSHQCIGLSSV